MLKPIFFIIILFLSGCANKTPSEAEARQALENQYPNIVISSITIFGY